MSSAVTVCLKHKRSAIHDKVKYHTPLVKCEKVVLLQYDAHEEFFTKNGFLFNLGQWDPKMSRSRFEKYLSGEECSDVYYTFDKGILRT